MNFRIFFIAPSSRPVVRSTPSSRSVKSLRMDVSTSSAQGRNRVLVMLLDLLADETGLLGKGIQSARDTVDRLVLLLHDHHLLLSRPLRLVVFVIWRRRALA
jgi:hypothetical protein